MRVGQCLRRLKNLNLAGTAEVTVNAARHITAAVPGIDVLLFGVLCCCPPGVAA